MILVTVGTQLPFDRLINMVDSIAPTFDERMFAQVGEGRYTPQHMQWSRSLDASGYDKLFADARVIVSHAGIGTVLRADREGKPLVLLARQAQFGEHRDDHQVATCNHLSHIPGIYIANDAEQIKDLLAQPLSAVELASYSSSRENLIEFVRSYLETI